MKSEKGITLIALIITIIVLIILASITIGVATSNNGIIKKSKNAKTDWKDKEGIEVGILNEDPPDDDDPIVPIISDKVIDPKDPENITKNITIKANINSFNATLGKFPIVYQITAVDGEDVIYDDMVYANVENIGGANIKCPLTVPKGTVVTITEVYNGGNYKLTSEEFIETTIIDENAESFSFNHEYDYQMKGNSGTIL